MEAEGERGPQERDLRSHFSCIWSSASSACHLLDLEGLEYNIKKILDCYIHTEKKKKNLDTIVI